MGEKKESAVKRNRTLITGSARVPPMWREYKQGFHPCGKSTVYLSERTGSWREGTLVPGSLPWAKARFFRGYDGVFKSSSFTVFCALTRERAVIKARTYYGLWSPVVCTALLQSIKQKIKITNVSSFVWFVHRRRRGSRPVSSRGYVAVLLMD